MPDFLDGPDAPEMHAATGGRGTDPAGYARLLEAVLATSPDRAIVMQRDGGGTFRCRHAGPAERAPGPPLSAAPGCTAAELGLPPALTARLERDWADALAGGVAVAGATGEADPDGHARRFEHATAPLPGVEGAVACWVRDVTERALAERAGRAAVRRLEALIGSLQAGVLVEDDRGQVVLANAAFCALMGLEGPPEALLGANAVRLARRCRGPFDDPDGFLARADALRRSQPTPTSEQLALADGRFFERDHVPVFAGDGTGGHLWVFRDVTERRRAEERLRDYAVVLEFQKGEMERANAELGRANAELEHANAELAALATTDGLTGLANHRAFREALAEEAARAGRDGAPLSLVLLDVDHFKAYNDAFGHPAGDALLRDLAALLRDLARAGDVAARHGGEEFGVLLPATGAAEALRRAERLRAAIAGAAWAHRAVTVSVGVGTLPASPSDPGGQAEEGQSRARGGADADRLLADADKALYRAKAGGRNRVVASP